MRKSWAGSSRRSPSSCRSGSLRRPTARTSGFPTRDGLMLAGTYLSHRAGRRLGVVVFSHEFLGDRWSVLPYLDHLRELGFDLFSFDYRNHGQSDPDPKYKPLQWVTNHEVNDLRAALAYVRSRPDADPAGVGLFGVSRGGGTALCVASKDARVWGVATDGAFPTSGTMLAYITRWAEIYVPSTTVWRNMPKQVYSFLAWSARKRSQSRLNCRFPEVETAVARLAPRPLFMIHGEKDAYIGPEIAEELFRLAGAPKELWVVPKAKHNRCREIAGRGLPRPGRRVLPCHGPRVSKASSPTQSPRGPREATNSAGGCRLRRSPRSSTDGRRCQRPLPLIGARHCPGRRRIDRHDAVFNPQIRGHSSREPRSEDGPRLSRAQARQAGDVQRKLLLDRVARHADSQFGRDHHFARDQESRRLSPPRVPVRDYSEHEPYIDRVRQGDTCAPLRRWDRSADVRPHIGYDEPAQDNPCHT